MYCCNIWAITQNSILAREFVDGILKDQLYIPEIYVYKQTGLYQCPYNVFLIFLMTLDNETYLYICFHFF